MMNTAVQETGEVSAEVDYLKKITAKTVNERPVEVPTKSTALFTIVGIADGVKRGTTQYGEFVGFVGTFEAIRMSDGKRFAAPIAFVPQPMQDMLLARCERKVLSQDKDDKPVTTYEYVPTEFACEVGVRPAQTKTGYEYYCKPIAEPGKADPLAALRGRLPTLARILGHDRVVSDGEIVNATPALAAPSNGGKRK